MEQKTNTTEESALRVKILNLDSKDTIVLQFDLDTFSIEEVQQLAKMWKREYPQNKIMITFKGAEIKGVIHESF